MIAMAQFGLPYKTWHKMAVSIFSAITYTVQRAGVSSSML